MPTTIFTPQMLRNGTRSVPEIPAGGGAPFVNTYSLDFDGVDDYLQINNSTIADSGNFTLSFWIKGTTQVGLNYLFSTSTYYNLNFFWQLSGTNIIWKNLNNVGYTVAVNVLDNDWHHIMIIWNPNGANSTIRCYVDGANEVNVTTDYRFAPNWNGGAYQGPINFIGGKSLVNQGSNIQLDEFAAFVGDREIDLATIYNGGTPTDLSLLATPPLHWYRNGDNGSWKSPQWLIPNNENKDKSSNYSFDFDGVDDYVDCGNSAALKPNIITVSCWIKGSANSAFTRIISQDGPTGGADAYGIYVTPATNKIVFGIKTNVTGTVTSATSGVVLDNNWHHLVGIYNGSEVILYVDGVAVGSPSAGTSVLSYGSGTLTIGCFSEPTLLPSYLFNGNIDEVAIFDSVIPIGDLWDGSGEPIDVSSVSGIVSYYKMGEESTFSTNWTVPDSVGSNNGTSANMTIEDRVGNAPNSNNNAVSLNMDEVDRTTDVPT